MKIRHVLPTGKKWGSAGNVTASGDICNIPTVPVAARKSIEKNDDTEIPMSYINKEIKDHLDEIIRLARQRKAEIKEALYDRCEAGVEAVMDDLGRINYLLAELYE